MLMPRPITLTLLFASAVGISGCAYDSYGYGHGGGYATVGYGGDYCDPNWDDCRGYYGDPWYGWYDNYYYPGWGIYVYDGYRRPHRWNDSHRRYWESRRGGWGGRDWNDRRWERWDGWERRDHGDGDWNRGDRNWRRDDRQNRWRNERRRRYDTRR